MTVPYASATSGSAARAETARLLRRMGCESVGSRIFGRPAGELIDAHVARITEAGLNVLSAGYPGFRT